MRVEGIRAIWLPVLVKLGLVACAVGLLALTELPDVIVLLTGLIGICLILGGEGWWSAGDGAGKITSAVAWVLSVLLPLGFLGEAQRFTLLQTYYAVIVWLMAAAMLLTARRSTTPGAKLAWKLLATLWLVAGEFIWLADAYTQNRELDFYLGLAFGVLLLVGLKRYFPLPRMAVLVANTFILIFLFLPLADFAVRPPAQPDPEPNVAGNGYLYRVARTEPQAFDRFWNRQLRQYAAMMKAMAYPDPGGILPYRVRTNVEVSFFQSRIHLNNRGLRGRDIRPRTNRTFRILALGESNTFGFTLNPEHKPWPELLEQLIQRRLKPGLPIRVINAGLPHHSLEDNLHRLESELLRLRPDLIISYHGWNGFPWLYPELPPVFVKHLPDYRRRPLVLLAECEYRARLLIFKRSMRAGPVVSLPSTPELLATRYGLAYQRLIEIARTNGIALVLANYSMAVNATSVPDVIEFYRKAFPAVYPTIQVNVMHSKLLAELARRHPEVLLVDTRPDLDGAHDKFIDLVHFAPEGDRQLAETLFAGITNWLRLDMTNLPVMPARL